MTADPVQSLIDQLHEEAALDLPDAETPEVGIVMGSDSDLPMMAGGKGKRPGAHAALVEELGFAEQTDYQDPPEARFTFETFVEIGRAHV